jgi:hypothetical protein
MRVIRFTRAVGKVKCCADIGHCCFPKNVGRRLANCQGRVKTA